MSVSRVILLVLLATPSIAAAEGLRLFASGGPMATDQGLNAGIGLSLATPILPLQVMADLEYSRFPATDEATASSSSSQPKRTVLAGYVAVQIRLIPLLPASPYLLAGVGKARFDQEPSPQVLGFKDTVTAGFGGAGAELRLGSRMRVFAEARLVIIGTSDTHIEVPIKAGLSLAL